jgi:hypothetical protein
MIENKVPSRILCNFSHHAIVDNVLFDWMRWRCALLITYFWITVDCVKFNGNDAGIILIQPYACHAQWCTCKSKFVKLRFIPAEAYCTGLQSMLNCTFTDFYKTENQKRATTFI